MTALVEISLQQTISVAIAVLAYVGVAELIKHCAFRRPRKEAQARPYAERLAHLTESLRRSSKELDAVLTELVQVAKDREAAVKNLEVNLTTLEVQEQQAKIRLEALEKVSNPAVVHFAKLIESGARRGAKRDYVLFGAGAVVSAVTAVVLKYFGLG